MRLKLLPLLLMAGSPILTHPQSPTIRARDLGIPFDGITGQLNPSSVGLVRDATLAWMDEHHYYNADKDSIWYAYPLVAETYDGILNDINGFHVKKEDVLQALETASSGQVAEGNTGGGTGMICHGFKGGTGTASRVIDKTAGGYT